jgi:hypothetical protein
LSGVTGNALSGTTGTRYAGGGSQGIESCSANEISRGNECRFLRRAIAATASNSQASGIHELRCEADIICYQADIISA